MGNFTMPSLGADMEAGTLVEWLKRPGDEVHRGDIVAVVETEKGAIEVEIFEDGRIDELLVTPGTKVPVGTVLATLGAPVSERAGPAAQLPESQLPAAAAAAMPVPEPARLAGFPPSSPSSARLKISPAARQLAKVRGLNPADLAGTGPEGAIVVVDIPAEIASPHQRGKTTSADMDPMRHAIALAMARSKREIPHYYLWHSIDIGPAKEWLEAYNSARPAVDRLLLAALLIKASSVALRDFPEFNGFWRDDRFEPSEAIHAGIAIAIRGGGLAAPAIHDSDKHPLSELMTRLRDLSGRVRSGGFRSSEISDPTMTISSLGERGVEALFPVIYPPQVAILGFGTGLFRPWVLDGAIVVRPIITVSLAADHRASDGHRGALLLQRIGDLLGQPEDLS